MANILSPSFGILVTVRHCRDMSLVNLETPVLEELQISSGMDLIIPNLDGHEESSD